MDELDASRARQREEAERSAALENEQHRARTHELSAIRARDFEEQAARSKAIIDGTYTLPPFV
jgi:hypothetical protein